MIRQQISVLGDQFGKGFVCRTALAARIVREREFETSVAFVRLEVSFAQGCLAIAAVDRLGGIEDLAATRIGGIHAMAVGEQRDARVRGAFGIGEIREDSSGIDRGELVRVADQDERCGGR